MDEVLDRYEAAGASASQEETDNDIWDDTALIKAYDKAIKQAQQANAELQQPKSKKKKGKKKGKKKEGGWKWNTGNECQAVYSEDGLIYDAVITRMLPNSRCIVLYTDYGNEEEQLLKDLIRPQSVSHQRAESVASMSSIRSQTCSECSTSTNPANNYMSPRFASPEAQSKSVPHSTGWPSFIPPPPPSIPDMSSCDSDEAFHTMLISWYMSGFHTGYYQGLRDGKKS
ncbi:SMN1 [Bugula neritina]|uniref:SMN1 n=1 Tax=Bugula neritina TaxID=10212 RepID=A0A7J7J5M0_BUGNE|nr:SMN1 [Bugula neritina]